MTRIKQWDLSKNLRAKDKEVLAAEIARAHSGHQPLNQVKFKGRPVKVDRVVRHYKALFRKRKRAAIARHDKTHDPQSRAGDGKQSSIRRGQAAAPGQFSMALAKSPASRAAPAGSKQHSLITPRLLRPGHDGTDIELLLYSTSAFYSTLSTVPPSSLELMSKSTSFWVSIKSAIYFLKKHTPRLAWPLLNNACQAPISVLVSEPILLLRELFSTLSPINTKMHSQVRLMLLRYLRQLSYFGLGVQHPLTTILAQLVLDNGTRQVSETGIRYLLSPYEPSDSGSASISVADDSDEFQIGTSSAASDYAETTHSQSQINTFSSRHQLLPTASHAHYVSTLRALINLHRRDYALSSALTLSDQLIRYTTVQLSPSHPLTLTGLTEKVHILSDLCDYRPALKIAHHILDIYRSIQGDSFPNSKACYAMEVPAELNHITGDTVEEEKWLRLSLEGAWKVRGGDASVMFVRGKLEELLDGQGRIEETANLKLRYPEQNIETVQ